MEPVRIGIIGCGVIGSRHADAAARSTQIELVALADVRSEVAQALAATVGCATVYDAAEALLADGRIEGVVLAMPAHLRTALAQQAFAAGKHVLTEKPVALNSAEVQTLLDAQGDRVAACCSSRYHFLEATSTVKAFVAGGALGALREVRCRAIVPAGAPPRQPPPPWRLNRALNGGGILMNWGCYDLDYLLGITGWSLHPQTVLAQCWGTPPDYAAYAAPGSDAETHVTALVRCAGGVVISYERAEFIAAQRELAWELIGDRGSLRLQMTPAPDGRMVHFQADATTGVVASTLCTAQEEHSSVHDGPINDFALAIRTGSTPQTSFARALIIQQITDAIYASAATGTAVAIPEGILP
ncbi:MAG: Gfo/Idh/MocA family oxidoreductase [Caldilineaceae bacterium]